jgi:16S rRNA (cytidine1402-2'-O)-methyltransferase
VKEINSGTLYICGTPIGNLEDITLRVIRILGEVDLIASEDTRNTAKLLQKFNITTKQTSYHRHNIHLKSQKLLEKLRTGENIALVSDAGMPGISDPGEDIISLCIKEKIPVTVLPGPSSVTTALVLSGISTQKFIFEGFLPRDGKTRRKKLKELQEETRTIIIFLSPHRISQELKDLNTIMGDRNVFMGRELTKKFEECWRGNVQSLISHIENREIKGEITLVVEGKKDNIDNTCPEIEIKALLKELISGGIYGKEAIKKAASIKSVPKSEVYKIYLSMKNML